MRRILMIGLGGSGGKTVSFLMDQLLVKLKNEGWTENRLPEGWQFVHIDVPGAADGIGSGLAAPVQLQGGTYIGLASDASPYTKYAESVESGLESQTPSDLSYLSRWEPDQKANAINLQAGAGAYRAIGRVVTVSKSNQIYANLSNVIERLNSMGARDDNSRVGKLLKVDNARELADQSPIVLMVSSLSGGSGASMVLDVADILRAFGNKSFDSEHIAAFLYTGDVFKSLGIFSAAPGSIATMSELINSIYKIGVPWTEKEWARVGVKTALPEATGRGPWLIVPVGASVNNVPFGESTTDVYRGFAGMLAPIYHDKDIQEDFVAYQTANFRNEALAAPDHSEFAKKLPLQNEVEVAHFAAWGSATLSMGRDRYVEYAAQRVARVAVENLVSGHVDQAVRSGSMTAAQAIGTYAGQFYPLFWKLFDPANNDGNLVNDAASYVDAAFPKSIRNRLAQEAIGKEFSAYANGEAASTAAAKMAATFPKKVAGIIAAAETQSLNSIETWANKIQTNLEDATLRIASLKGLEVADKVLDQAKNDLIAVQVELDRRAANAPAPNAFSESVIAALKRFGNSPLIAGGPLDVVISEASMNLDKVFMFTVAKIQAKVLDDFIRNSLTPLREAIRRLSQDLNRELGKTVASVAGAAYREAPLQLWPTNSDVVPNHFQPAINEILLENINAFPSTFSAQIAQAMTSSALPEAEAASELVTQLKSSKEDSGEYSSILGWAISRAAGGSHPHIGREASWYPAALGSLDGRVAGPGRYSLKLMPNDVLDYARTWINLPSTPFRLYSQQGIQEWLAGTPQMTKGEIEHNRQTFTSALAETLQYASPLVEIDEGLVSKIHGAHLLGLKFSFSSIPFSESDELLSQVQAKIKTFPKQAMEVSISNLKKNCNPAKDVKEIFICSRPGNAYLPMVFSSLMAPIRDTWAQSKAADVAEAYWTWRRARPLTDFVPASQEWIEAFLQGWIMGRITGHIQLEPRTDGVGGSLVKVYDDQEQTWAYFPEKLLGVANLGDKINAAGADNSNWNVPAALLESLMLAMAHCVGGNLEPVRAYQVVVRHGASLTIKPAPLAQRKMIDPLVWWNAPTGAPQGRGGILDSWFTFGSQARGLTSPISSVAQAQSSEERREKAVTWLNTVRERMVTLTKNGVRKVNFKEVNREFEIATFLTLAIDSVLSELKRGDLGQTAQAETIQMVVQSHPEDDQVTPPDVEG